MPDNLPELPSVELPAFVDAMDIYRQVAADPAKKVYETNSRIPLYKAIEEVMVKEYQALSQTIADCEAAQKIAGGTEKSEFGQIISKLQVAVVQSELRPAFDAGRLKEVQGEVADQKQLQKLLTKCEKDLQKYKDDVSPELKADIEKLKARVNNLPAASDRIPQQAIDDQKKYLDDHKPQSSLNIELNNQLATALKANLTETSYSLSMPFSQTAVKETKIS